MNLLQKCLGGDVPSPSPCHPGLISQKGVTEVSSAPGVCGWRRAAGQLWLGQDTCTPRGPRMDGSPVPPGGQGRGTSLSTSELRVTVLASLASGRAVSTRPSRPPFFPKPGSGSGQMPLFVCLKASVRGTRDFWGLCSLPTAEGTEAPPTALRSARLAPRRPPPAITVIHLEYYR